TSPTRRSPSEVSFGTPTRIAARLYLSGRSRAGAWAAMSSGKMSRRDPLLHRPWPATPVRRGDAGIVRAPAARRDRADRLRRPRLAGALRDRVGDRGRGARCDRRRQPRLLADRKEGRAGAVPALALAEPLLRSGPAAGRAADAAARRQGRLLRAVRHRAALHGGLDRGHRADGLVEVL